MNILPITHPAPDPRAAGGEVLSLLSPGRFAELHAAGQADAAAAEGLALAAIAAFAAGRPVLWVRHGFIGREIGEPHAGGLRELGIDPTRVVVVDARTPLAALQAGLEGVRSTGTAAVLIGLWGETRAYDLVASRRLALAAEETRTALVLVRVVAEASPSAAAFRWSVAAAASRPYPANAPGRPAFDVRLLRARSGAAGARHRVEWNRDARILEAQPLAPFSVSAEPDGRRDAPRSGPALSGSVVPLPVHRPVPPDEPVDRPRAG